MDMFDRVKPNYDIIRTKVEVELVGKNGDKFLVAKHINYAQKEQMAYEMAAAALVIDEDTDACYLSFKKILVEAWLIAKYYTNLELPEDPDDEDYEKLFDYLIYNELHKPLMEVVSGDYFGHVEGIAHMLIEAAKTVHEKEHSLARKVDQAFGFLFNGEDLTDQIAQAEGINEKLVDMFEAVREREQKNAMLKGSRAKVNSGGTVLNMAKK